MKEKHIVMYFGNYFLSAAIHGQKNLTKRVVAVENGIELWEFLDKLLDDLGCCEDLFAPSPLNNVCQKCSRTHRSGNIIRTYSSHYRL
jgi:hypothetical protein